MRDCFRTFETLHRTALLFQIQTIDAATALTVEVSSPVETLTMMSDNYATKEIKDRIAGGHSPLPPLPLRAHNANIGLCKNNQMVTPEIKPDIMSEAKCVTCLKSLKCLS